ncbi:calmin isoform X2 [Falco rusticolus]|uniref:calmin isoform X2 n=2 Tax=Falco TaxID=8952 RepID=UPI0018869AC3|nr:calmin isoform X2 [Falco rusticolus]XP_055571119.1 calmin isoform X1 [Falco cherrug]
MAGQEWDWFQREELIGHISDIRVQNLQVERENVQKRTFTRWINLHLGKRKPPLKVKDLFIDIQDGKILMALLEVLSGQKLMHEYKSSTHRIFRLNNIAKALKFLEDSNVKLVSIDAAEIADGNSSLVLGLIWNIILFFQIKELTGNLNRNSSSSSLSSGPSGPESDTSHPSTPSVERNMSVTVKDQRKAIRALLIWVQRKTRKYGVAVQDFTSSWRSGLAFLAVIKAIDSTLVDMKQALEKSARENLEDAFSIAQNKLGVPRLLEPEDIMVESPDEQSIVTYVAQFLEHFPELEGEDFTDPDKELPIESTYVHIKDTPSEKEGKILILSESEENMYTVNHERSHPAPPKVHIHDTPERIQSETVPEKCNGKLSQVLGDSQETSEEEPRRPTSLKITGSVSFESNSSWEVLSDKVMPGEGGISDDPLKQNDDLSPAVLTDQKNSVDSFEDYSEELTKETSTEYDNETKSLSANTSSLSPLSWTSGILTDESINKVEESKPQTSVLLPEDTSKEENTHKYVLHLLNEEILKLPQNEHTKQSSVFEAIETNHCSLNGSNLKSQELSTQDETSDDSLSDVPKNPEDMNSSDEVEFSAEVPPSSSKVSVIPHDLFYYPHYNVPISAVLNAYLEPCIDTEGYDTENDKASSETVTDVLCEKGLLEQNNKEDAPDPDLGNKISVPPSEIDTENSEEETTDINSDMNSSDEKEVPLLVREELEIEKDGEKATSHQDSPVPPHPETIVEHLEDLSVAIKRPEESSNREEEGKNTIEEDLQVSEVATATLSQDKLEEIAVCQEMTRTNDSDSNTYLRKRFPNTSEEAMYGVNEQKVTDMGENPLIIRKKKDLEASETPAPTHEITIVDQPELFYFIIFFWVLVYCLLLLPHLLSNKV